MTRIRLVRQDAVQSPLATYFRDINETPVLTAGEEKQLAYRVEQGDSEARDQMARANLRLVVSIARGYLGKGLSLEDLIAEGNLGLLRAIEAFDPNMNIRFSTYASFWIKQSIRRGLVNTGRTIRIPAYMVNLLTKWRRAAAKLQEDLGRPPSQEEIAESLKLSRKRFNIIKKSIRIHDSAPKSENANDEMPLGEILMDGRSKAPDAEIGEADDLKQVLQLLGTMKERDAAVLRMRFGLDNEEPKALVEIGERLGLTRERVRQIEREALNRLSEGLQPK